MKPILLILSLCLTGCAMTPEERAAWNQFAIDSAKIARDRALKDKQPEPPIPQK